MNVTTVQGILNGDAEIYCDPGKMDDVPLVIFYLKDYSDHRHEPNVFQIRFKKLVGMDLFPYLKNGTEVMVSGPLFLKPYKTSFGENRQRLVLDANFIEFTGYDRKDRCA